ncbi:MarR family winged helix-turn-helix transcriptional regulator [Streptomyces sp. NPDC056390]|uniref:MarR family winged helix-turn-helix transcriptional regulator n=1 Tax=Streptomyces sp. NPDC056390 TaxID=3345806 RepID=UPI0035E144F0
MTDSAIEGLADRLSPRLLRVSQAMRRETESLPLTVAQSSVLNQLILGPRKIGELARAEGVRLPSMTQTVGRMEKAGWVTRSGGAGRGNDAVITELGLELAQEVDRIRAAALAARLAELSEAEVEALWASLSALDLLFGSPGEPAR